MHTIMRRISALRASLFLEPSHVTKCNILHCHSQNHSSVKCKCNHKKNNINSLLISLFYPARAGKNLHVRARQKRRSASARYTQTMKINYGCNESIFFSLNIALLLTHLLWFVRKMRRRRRKKLQTNSQRTLPPLSDDALCWRYKFVELTLVRHRRCVLGSVADDGICKIEEM